MIGSACACAAAHKGSSAHSPILTPWILAETIAATAPRPAARFEFDRGVLRIRQWNDATNENLSCVRLAPRGQGVVEHPVPRGAGIAGQSIAIDVRPGRHELPIKPLPVEARAAKLRGFHQLRKERPHLETIIEGYGRRLAVIGREKPDPDLSAAIRDRGNQLRRNIMGMNIDGHGASLFLFVGGVDNPIL